MAVDGGVYIEEEEEVGGIEGGVGGAGGGGGGDVATETAPEERRATWEEGSTILVSLYLYLIISLLTALSWACKDCTSCCKAEIAPMQP